MYTNMQRYQPCIVEHAGNIRLEENSQIVFFDNALTHEPPVLSIDPFLSKRKFLKKGVGLMFIVSRWIQTSKRGGATPAINEDRHGPWVWDMDTMRLGRSVRHDPCQNRVNMSKSAIADAGQRLKHVGKARICRATSPRSLRTTQVSRCDQMQIGLLSDTCYSFSKAWQ